MRDNADMLFVCCVNKKCIEYYIELKETNNYAMCMNIETNH